MEGCTISWCQWIIEFKIYGGKPLSFFNFLSLIGGLALFLYGMEVLGEGLSKLTGGKLEKILEKLTSNPVKVILLGAGVTAVIQSSSATTVMVVGLVNSNVMKLQQHQVSFLLLGKL